MKTNSDSVISRKIQRALAGFSLNRLAKALCLCTEACDEAGDAILYGLPGVFSMELQSPDASARLIKEARALRQMKNSEKSDILLTIRFEDLAVVGDINARECTIQKALSEGRATFAGKTKHLAAVLRAGAAGDKERLPSEEYFELYGKKKEE